MLPGLTGLAGFNPGRVALSYGSFDSWTTKSDGFSYTSGSLSIGAAPTGGNRRYVVAVCGTNAGASGLTLDSVDIGGSAAIEVATADNNGSGSCSVALYYREVSAGTTTTVSFTVSGTTAAGANILVLTITTGPDGLTLRQGYSDPANSNPSITYDASPGDLVVGGTMYRNGRVGSYDGLTFLGDEPGDTSDYGSIGYREVSAPLSSEVESPNATNAGDEECFVLGVFSP